MNIALIDASPKARNSASGLLLAELETCLAGEFTRIKVPPVPDEAVLARFDGQDALVFAFPLYVDGLPSHLVRCLAALETRPRERPAVVYGVANCGFFEGRQNRLALQILRHWSGAAGLAWGGGLGVGGGGMLSALAGVPAGHGPRKTVSQGLRALASDVMAARQTEDRFVSPNFPRWLYKAMAQMGWRSQLAANGGKRRDLSRQL